MNNKHKNLGNLDIKNITRIKSICAGKGCNNVGTIPAKILFIEKEALFCTSCKKDLEKRGLITDFGGN